MKKNQKIKVHYNFSGDRNAPLVKSLNDWNNNEALKKWIKFHYSIVQDDTCPYCREKIRRGGYGEPIEQIFPKSLGLNWMFKPSNLCLSCYGCNTKKQDKPTLELPCFPVYPQGEGKFFIIHPHFDNYSKHIDSSNLILKPKNNSVIGRNTIEICQLNRIDLLFTRAKRSKKNKNILLNHQINSLASSAVDDEERQLAGKFIADLIKRAQHKEKING